MELLPEATSGQAKFGCYVCLIPGPVVTMEAMIEGEGELAICGSCLTDAMNVAMRRLPEDPISLELGSTKEKLASMEMAIVESERLVTLLFDAWKRFQAARPKQGKAAASREAAAAAAEAE